MVQWSRVGFLVGLGVRNKSRLLVFYKYINNICFREGVKKTFFFWEISPKSVYPPTHPRVFVRFGSTKGEIRVKKGDFRGDLGGLDLVWESATPPTHIWEKSTKKKLFFRLLIDG